MIAVHEPLASVPAFGLKLDPGKPLLFKFYLNRLELVPPGLKEIHRPPNVEMDHRQAEKAIARGDERSAMDGRVRPSRKDTGNPVYQNVERVQIGSLRSLLALRGYKLEFPHFFKQSGYGKNPRDQWVVVLGLDANREESEPLSQNTLEGLRALARESVYTADVWDNHDKQTLNFRKRQPDQKPLTKIVQRDGYIRLLDAIEGQDAAELERQEDLASIEEIEQLLASLKKLT